MLKVASFHNAESTTTLSIQTSAQCYSRCQCQSNIYIAPKVEVESEALACG